MRRFSIAALVLLVSIPALCTDNLDSQLQKKYKYGIYLIQGFPSNNTLQYNAAGVLISPSQQGSWENGGILINSIKVRRDRVEFTGNRALFFYEPFVKQLQAKKGDDIINVSIAIDRKSEHRASDLLLAAENVFLDYHAQPPRDAAPEFWAAIEKLFPTRGVCDEQATVELPCRVRDGVTAPKAIQTPDPDYSELARKYQLSGMVELMFVVDQTGVPQNIHAVLSLGFGLDDKAIEAVQRWRFQPATFQGKPVPVLLSVDIRFRLY